MAALDAYYRFLNSVMVLRVLAVAGLPLSIVAIVLFFLKSHRDERGWKILGKASIVTFIVFIVLLNVIAKIGGQLVLYDYTLGRIVYAVTPQLIYDVILLVEVVTIFILRRIE